jgi:hypothetical protein
MDCHGENKKRCWVYLLSMHECRLNFSERIKRSALLLVKHHRKSKQELKPIRPIVKTCKIGEKKYFSGLFEGGKNLGIIYIRVRNRKHA